MPSKRFDPTKPSFYLDNSTLCDGIRACRAAPHASTQAAYLPMLPWVERVANEANLCMAVRNHSFEI